MDEGYEEFQRAMSQADPRLEEPRQSPAPAWLPWHRARPRVVALHLGADGSFEPQAVYQDSNELQTCLGQRARSNVRPRRSVYILEALSREFVQVLGSHFHLHPSLFQDHQRLVGFGDRATKERGGIPFLPSAICGRDHVSLKYNEPLLFSPPPTGFRNLCDVSGRHIMVTRIMGEFSGVGIARCKCTFWSRKTEAGGWDCLIICDPPVKRVLTNYAGTASYSVTTSPYNGGYVDFMPHKDQIRSRSGPPRTSFLDDINFYLRTHSSALDLADPSSLRIFVEKIAASHYLKLAEFLQSIIEIAQGKLSRRQDLTDFAVAVAEGHWSDVQALGRRIGECKDDLEAIMLQLRMPFDYHEPNRLADWRDSAVDYQFLYLRFKEIGQRADSLNGSSTALAGLTNNRQAFKAQELSLQAQELSLKAARRSICEAMRVKALTIMGVVFIPLAYAASLFSMSDPYRPGGKLFWVYFVTAFPLAGLVVPAYHISEVGYVDDGRQWSFRAAVRFVKENLK